MAKQKYDTATGDVQLGPLTIPAGTLEALPIEDYGRNGVVLTNERIKVNISHADLPCIYTLSLYVQREAWTDEERDSVVKTAEEKNVAKDKRERAEQDLCSREKKVAFELGQESTMSSLKNIADLAQAARALAGLTTKDDDGQSRYLKR